MSYAVAHWQVGVMALLSIVVLVSVLWPKRRLNHLELRARDVVGALKELNNNIGQTEGELLVKPEFAKAYMALRVHGDLLERWLNEGK